MRCSPRRSPLLAPVAHGCSDRHLQYVEIGVVLCVLWCGEVRCSVMWCVVLCVVWCYVVLCGVMWCVVLCYIIL